MLMQELCKHTSLDKCEMMDDRRVLDRSVLARLLKGIQQEFRSFRRDREVVVLHNKGRLKKRVLEWFFFPSARKEGKL